MNLNTRITGPAGMGVNSTAEIIIDIFAKLGYSLITDIEYESRIKGGVNYFDVNISNEGDKFLTKKVNILIALNSKSLEAQIGNLKENGVIICSEKTKNENSNHHSTKDNLNFVSLEIDDKYENTYLLALYFQYLGVDLDVVLKKIEKIFAKKGEEVVKKNLEILKNVYENSPLTPSLREGKAQIKIQKTGNSKQTIYGNKAVAKGAIEGGLEFYSAYPMTPASSILTEIVNDGRITYIQNEDEIAVVNSALGASFTGARAMSGTSGGGFALMTEALSFAVMAELPITIVLSQRAGPSTGTPTYHETGDITFALYPTFGDFKHVVLYPSNLEEAYYFAGLAQNIADKYQTQVIYLMDKQASEMFGTIENLTTPKIERGEFINPCHSELVSESLKIGKNNFNDSVSSTEGQNVYKRYELTESGISPRVKVGTPNGEFIATSYEHDEYGATTENQEIKKAMTEKRFKKLENFFEKEGISGYEIINPEAKKMLVVAGFISYTAKKFVKENPEFGLIILKVLKPFDDRLIQDLLYKDELIFVESNYSGQIENYLRKELGLDDLEIDEDRNKLEISHLRKYDLVPFYIEDFENLIN